MTKVSTSSVTRYPQCHAPNSRPIVESGRRYFAGEIAGLPSAIASRLLPRLALLCQHFVFARPLRAHDRRERGEPSGGAAIVMRPLACDHQTFESECAYAWLTSVTLSSIGEKFCTARLQRSATGLFFCVSLCFEAGAPVPDCGLHQTLAVCRACAAPTACVEVCERNERLGAHLPRDLGLHGPLRPAPARDYRGCPARLFLGGRTHTSTYVADAVPRKRPP